jgi:hypothetical protein
MEEESQPEKKVNLQHTVEPPGCEFSRLPQVESSIDGGRIEKGVHSFDRPVAIAGLDRPRRVTNRLYPRRRLV